MAIEDILAGLAGAAKGGLDMYSWQKEYEQANRKIEQDGEIKRLQQEIKVMLESMKEQGRNQRWETPSANVTTQQEGQTARTNITTGAQREIADQRDQTTRRGQDFTFDLGVMRDSTTQRGQDIGAATTQRGQDIGAATTRRGQDLTFDLGMSLERGRSTRATDALGLRRREMESRERIARQRNASRDPWAVDFGASLPVDEVEVDEGTGRPTAEPIEVVEQPAPEHAEAGAPRSPEASADEATRLETQALSLLEQFQREADPAKKQALRAQLTRLKEAILKAQQKGGQ